MTNITMLTMDNLNHLVVSVSYVYDERLTICVLRLNNGFKVVGHSSCFNDMDYNRKVGEQLAYQNALDRLWELEGYHIKRSTDIEE